jgi:hypothetical protein
MKSKSFILVTLALSACALFAVSFDAPRESLNVQPPAVQETAILAAQVDAPVLHMPAISPLAAQWLALGACIAVGAFLVQRFSRRLPIGRRLTAINTLPANVGSSWRSRRYRASGALSTRYVFVKAGADDEHVAAIAAVADKPIGVVTDEATAAEDPVNVELSLTERTLPLVAAEAIAALYTDLYMTAAGKVGLKPTAAGTYWKVGRNLTLAGAANDPVEVQLCEPRKLIVLAALTSAAGDIADTNSTAVNPTKSDFDSLLVAAGKLQADFHLLVAALKSEADIDFATT